ncbi:hypothetical protein [uncultured Bacteroides sp.]|uniref:hypothetical protein n=1 Tax=uncultured Bacteroides sp. TaxID=162156 RepID=UPI002674BC85|nr:hypothetical protein [uncultured Bacteroides sp.]
MEREDYPVSSVNSKRNRPIAGLSVTPSYGIYAVKLLAIACLKKSPYRDAPGKERQIFSILFSLSKSVSSSLGEGTVHVLM